MLWKIPLGYGILNLVAHMAIETSQFFSIWLKYMATIKFNQAIDLQIWIAQMAVLENIQSHTLQMDFKLQ